MAVLNITTIADFTNIVANTIDMHKLFQSDPILRIPEEVCFI